MLRILAVDDDDLSLSLLRNALTQAGYAVVTARDGREALRALHNNDFQIIISDWEMPGLDGLELCKAVRAGESSGYTYFILLTGRDRSQDLIDGLGAGADEFMTKPFRPTEMAVRLRTAERILSLETRDLTIFALAKLAESRDPETGAHLERVQNFSRLIAQDLSMQPAFSPAIDAAYVRMIYQTSPLHDIGKVAIPDSVLLKPGKLTAEEFMVMKTHALLGAQTLDAALKQHPGANFLRMAREIAASHHEKFDGSGYPAGLQGDSIPLSGRIVALADVYDALTSKRVYKDAMGHDRAKAMIEEGAGKHFDPQIVDSFLRNERHFIDIHHRFAEPLAQAA